MSNIRIFEPGNGKKDAALKGHIAEMLQSIDLIDLMENEYGLIFEGNTKKELTAFCPLPQHKRDESNRSYTPSLFVNPEKQVYKCWACGGAGTALQWIMSMDGVPFKDALSRLAFLSGFDTSDENFNTQRNLRDLSLMFDDIIMSGGETNLPGGMSEPEFLLLFAKRIRSYRTAQAMNPIILKWTDDICLKMDDLCNSENHKAMSKVWFSMSNDYRSIKREKV